MYIHLNGQLIPAQQGSIHYQDRGFRFGDGVFETIRVHESIPYLWEAHIQRLQQGLDTLQILADSEALDSAVKNIIHANHLIEGIVRISISRGVGSRGYLPMRADHPTVLIETMDLPPAPAAPIHLCISELRRIPPMCLPTHLKITQGLNSTLARMDAQNKGCFDAIQLSTNDHIAECSSFNLLWVRDNTVFAPSLDTGCLAGITASQLFRHMPWKLKLGRYRVSHLLKADAIIITNSASLVLPVHGIYGAKEQLHTFPKSIAFSERCRVFFEQNMAEYALDRSNETPPLA